MKNAMPNPLIVGISSPLALQPAISRANTHRCASPLAYCPLYTAPTPNGIAPRIPATVGLGPLGTGTGWGGMTGGTAPTGGIAPGTNPAAGAAPAIRRAYSGARG